MKTKDTVIVELVSTITDYTDIGIVEFLLKNAETTEAKEEITRMRNRLYHKEEYSIKNL